MIGLYLAINGMIFGILCSVNAQRKNRNMQNWFLIGFVFGILGLYALIMLVPNKLNSKLKDNSLDEANLKLIHQIN